MMEMEKQIILPIRDVLRQAIMTKLILYKGLLPHHPVVAEEEPSKQQNQELVLLPLAVPFTIKYLKFSTMLLIFLTIKVLPKTFLKKLLGIILFPLLLG